MAPADPRNVTVTVAVTDFNFDPNTATFTYSGSDIKPSGVINPPPGFVTIYTFTPASDSPWTAAPPLTPAPAAAWMAIDGWTVTVDATNLGKGASAGFRLSVVFQGGTFVDDPTIIMVDPPSRQPASGRQVAVHAAV
ncbi:MAG: hypothetical protein JOZ15_07400 [Acidobacteria bacterium]|nr:hypothetical protein [Acidobacteriota bacterium]